ncbi:MULTISPECIES: DUF4231 domain-containing protein [Streptomyces]|uniref:SMODS and SLOG-associating 2TM effector domain-containing protein n=1 Tax=Streptomyces venezuelae (strain ATCC 10712 / CBS 650.69 / DSM 40230 / JCM 4526 / NBRC 13096 / PD 04745) TaxID=953739 RepID=F2RDC6_STRVP|nr:DUF4231 domain-containing protein [Streptomyces venezuelae]APE24897.1 hypothetical protein vnz_30285 [Streptomyces venezuelae]QES02243.1 DUF4231 domain-containing protein [Streptomyces venezuelae ATCC 10712]CCA59418.1 hypothetical protein SVEN_6132 [Streptomyces venezuelae ATCC 10712]
MTVTQEQATIQQVWDQQSVWSQSANRLKKSVETARSRALALAVTAAVLATAASQVMDRSAWAGTALAFVAALAAGMSPLLAQRGGAARTSDWIRTRAVSEALKGEIYSCLAGVGPYADRASAPTVLADRARRFRGDATDLVRHTAGVSPVARPLPPVVDMDSYVEQRLRRQIDTYYRPKAAWMQRRVERFGRVELGFGALGALLAAAAGAFTIGGLAAWAAVIASVSIAVTAHAIAQRYTYQHLEFLRTAEELQQLLDRWTTARPADGEGTGAFVSQCEHVISIQNEAWMIRWTVG